MKKLIIAGLSIGLLAGCGSTDSKSETKTKETAKSTSKEQPQKAATWEEKVKKIAASEGTPNEKYDSINVYTEDYKPTDEEIKQFQNDIIKEYKDKKYIADLSNHEYTLGNIFKSKMVELNSQEQPMKDFAFHFWQSSNFNYRGVENKTYISTSSLERKMDEELSAMGK
ncbi:hypothetical protein CN527_04665 [Bacillus cereus]|nr:hypothetical protein CN527_04665 [Bacillus cereus]PFA35438.1 hypothetical protein CN390_04205 [Bacillus cereus]PFE65806.1 hypothetical protein CN316_22210 [Bacillus cereus]PGN92721.1 hypothetical protein CN976_23370 [Bacillus cereus]